MKLSALLRLLFTTYIWLLLNAMLKNFHTYANRQFYVWKKVTVSKTSRTVAAGESFPDQEQDWTYASCDIRIERPAH